MLSTFIMWIDYRYDDIIFPVIHSTHIADWIGSLSIAKMFI